MNYYKNCRRTMGRTEKNRRKKKKKIPKPLEDLSTIEQLESWMKSVGWTPSTNMKPTIFPVTHRGLITLENISPDTPLVKIPKELLITPSVAWNSNVKSIFIEKNGYTGHSVLATFLLYEKHLGTTSTWKHYLDSLPNSYTTPSYCTKMERNIMPFYMRQQTNILLQRMIVDYQSILKSIHQLKINCNDLCTHCLMSLPEIFTFEAFKWSYFTVNTRAIYMRDSNFINGGNIHKDDNLALAPFLDLLNHSFDAIVDVKPINNTFDESYQIYTSKAIQKNSQVFINYGNHCTLKLYVEYGFFIPNNPLDEIFIDYLFISKYKKISELKNKYILRNDFHENIGFTSQGLNYRAKISFFIICTTLKIIEMRDKIYCDNLNYRDELTSNIFSCKILNIERLKLMKDLKRMKSQINKSDSFKIGIDVQKEHISILDKCFNRMFYK
ncbi:SET domain-containing protein 4 isoform X2 [Microplitis demolitor]|uniref:SET domain-containing protein 4 isoform X2 n=1 Tax=Microplitis demolitor TaxID=69319 RepID=UPI0004CD748E|nr:SET domain-containing protein 4 isoform X2 [Microplitis demolitor]